jgi:hypothetical protein
LIEFAVDAVGLDKQIERSRKDVASRTAEHSGRARTCTKIGLLLQRRYEQTGDLAHLDEAIELEREAFASRPTGHPDRAVACAELASLLYICYQRTGDVSALDEAITLEREALDLQPPGHPDRYFTCSELDLLLSARWEQTADPALLDEIAHRRGQMVDNARPTPRSVLLQTPPPIDVDIHGGKWHTNLIMLRYSLFRSSSFFSGEHRC